MNAYELADQVEMWGEDLLALNMKGGIPVVEGAKLIRQQADRIEKLEELLREYTAIKMQQQNRISVLEANHEIQKRINEKALEYIDQLEQGLRTSIDLNRAQAERGEK